MGLFLCDICNEHLTLEKHVCNPEKISNYIHKLQDNASIAERRLSDMQNAVFMILQELPSLEGEKITINAEWLRRLWCAAQCRWY